jgi:spore germination cell wall hydrolase CwlJ-like protein
VTKKDSKLFNELTDLQLVALTLYLEARNQPQQAQIGIAWVIMLRVKHPSWMGRTIREVILKPKQFSEYNEDDPQYTLAKEIASSWATHHGADRDLREAVVIADLVLSGKIPNPFNRDDVLYFREIHCHPYYEPKQKKVAQWGDTGFWVDTV